MSVPGGWLSGWTLDPVVLGTSALVGILWLRGRSVLLARGESPSAGEHGGATTVDRRDEWWYWPAFVGAGTTLLLAACSPIDGYAGELFWVHMIQHLLLLVVAAPLFVAAASWLPVWCGLPRGVRSFLRRLAAVLPRKRGAPGRGWAVAAFALFVAGIWAWHLPALYDLALRNDVVHDYGEHTTFLVVGILFWLQVIPSPPFHPVLGYLGRAVLLASAIAQNVALSLLLGFGSSPLYAPYVYLAHRPGGISAMADQQVGAAIMWSVGDLPFVIALLALSQVWLRPQMESGPSVEEVTPVISTGPRG